MKPFDLFSPTEEHKILRDTVREFTKSEVEPQAHEHDRKERFNISLFRKLGELGLLGITVPEAFGGAGMDALASCIALEELSYSDPGFALAYLAHSILCANNIAQNASAEQKQRYLPKLCTGEWIGAMAMSEPNAGTDVLGMESRAVQAGENYLLTGRKMWITNGTLDDQGTPADVVLVYARSDVKDSGKKAEVTTFIVDTSMKGYSVGQKIMDKLGMRASNTAELVFDQVPVPKANLVGEPGHSLLHMMKNLEVERVALAAMSVGMARRALETMNRYAEDRTAFGNSLNRFGQIQRHIAESYVEYKSARCYLYEVARKLNLAVEGNRVDSDGVKLLAATMAKNVCDRAIQVLGGYGYVGEYTVERLWRDAKLIEIGGGTLEAHHKNITRDLAKNPHFVE